VRSTLVISDIHLCPVDRRTDCLSAHRRPENQPDEAVASLLNAAGTRSCTEVVLNGDVFDFDTSDCVSRTPDDLASYLDATLTDHARILAALGRLVRSGCPLTFVCGNHDAPLAYPAARKTLASRIAKTSGRNDGVQFRTWLHRTPDGIVIEHGHTYDPLCVLEQPGNPCETTVGAVIARRAADILPCLNPHNANPTALRAERYLSALKCAMQDGPERMLETVVASAEALRELENISTCRTDDTDRTLLIAAAAETGISSSRLAEHARLFSAKMCLSDMTKNPSWRERGSHTVERQKEVAGEIALIHNARAVVMGHTHMPQSTRLAKGWFGNSGVWASEAGIGTERNAAGHFVWIETDGANTRAATHPWQRRDTTAVT
jgi:UDP-2,3-diacylglucosamine pyrophosphatase LpxH